MAPALAGAGALAQRPVVMLDQRSAEPAVLRECASGLEHESARRWVLWLERWGSPREGLQV